NALNILGFKALIAGHHFEAHPFSLEQSLVAFPEDGGMVNKDVLPRFRGDEAETQFVVEPFHFSTGHKLFLPCVSAAAWNRRTRLPAEMPPVRLLLHTHRYDSYRTGRKSKKFRPEVKLLVCFK